MLAKRHTAHGIAVLCALFLSLAFGSLVQAQPQLRAEPNIQAALVAENNGVPGGDLMLAISFKPVSEEWHGYWENPGDAGYGMELDWQLPQGWTAGEPQYPVPKTLLLGGLMNHIYEGSYAVLVGVKIPADAEIGSVAQIMVDAQWLACTDKICVPEQARLELKIPVSGPSSADERFAGWRAAIPPLLDSAGKFEIVGKNLRIAIPLPAGIDLGEPHVFLANRSLGKGLQPSYAAAQSFDFAGDRLAALIPLTQLQLPEGDVAMSGAIQEIEGILSFGDNQAIHFTANPGAVPVEFGAIGSSASYTPPLGWLLLAALAGGLILNIMPCVFPILSLKALSLARAGASESQARSEGVAYSAGVVLACVLLGALMLALRAAGEQVGWAFQLQEPAVVVALFLLAAVITANFAGLFELPALPITRSGEPASAFATGLLAAVAATPCTGPFMAAAVGAALLLPSWQALILFAVLGLGLALPFLLIGFVPALRRMLPRPGPWMAAFRKLLAFPMGLTALALVWLLSRMGGQGFALIALIAIFGILIGLAVVGRLQQHGKLAWPAFGLIALPFLIFAAFALPAAYSETKKSDSSSLLNPVEYSAENLAEARVDGRPVFLWFTADWCVTCKVNESTAIEREATKAAFEKAGVITMRGDWTRPDPAITSYLTQHGAAGVPLYVWYAPGSDAQILPQVLTQGSLITLAEGSSKPAELPERGTGQ